MDKIGKKGAIFYWACLDHKDDYHYNIFGDGEKDGGGVYEGKWYFNMFN